jgi:hypothetical protein
MVLTQQTSTGAAPSLADEGVLASAVEALDGEQVIQAIGVGQPTPTSSTGPNDSAASPTSLQHYEGILIAEVTDEGSVDTRILLPHATVEAAEANVHAVREALATGTDVVSNRPLAELLPDATADVNGTVVVVTIPGSGNYRTPVGMLFARALFPVG